MTLDPATWRSDKHLGVVPRYFFDLRNDLQVDDEEGRDLADLTAVRTVAIAEARELITESVQQGHLNLDHRIEVRDELGEVVLVMRFGEAVQVTSDPRT